METKIVEIFVPAKGYEGYYEVSNIGNIKSLSKRIPCSSGKTRLLPEKILSNKPHIFGYVCRHFFKDKVGKYHFIHRMQWASFFGPIPPGKDINHINGIKNDNRLCNLELVTKKENIQHAIRTGLFNNKGENHTNSKLNPEKVREIRRMRKGGDTIKHIASVFKLNRCYTSLVATGKRWDWVT